MAERVFMAGHNNHYVLFYTFASDTWTNLPKMDDLLKMNFAMPPLHIEPTV